MDIVTEYAFALINIMISNGSTNVTIRISHYPVRLFMNVHGF